MLTKFENATMIDGSVPLGSREAILDHDRNQVTAPQFAVDGETKEGQVPFAVRQLQPGPDRPAVLRLQCWLCSE